jgi:hypothetical protein
MSMLRKALKWRISSAIDRDAPLGPLLRKRVDQDPVLAEFEAQSRRLCEELRRDAPAWIKQRTSLPAAATLQTPPIEIDRRRRYRRRRVVGVAAALALAASALVAVAVWQTTGPRRYQRMSQADRAELAAALVAGRANLAQFAHAITRVDAEVNWSAWRPPLSLDLAARARARASAQRVLAAFDQRVESQRQELAVGAKSACAFFTDRLPASMAALVGLQEG